MTVEIVPHIQNDKRDSLSDPVLWSRASTPFGDVLVAATIRGVCAVDFIDVSRDAVTELKLRFPGCPTAQGENRWIRLAADLLTSWEGAGPHLPVHLAGTRFQLSVWRFLAEIPFGDTATYSQVAAAAGNPRAARAAGSAVGSNPVSLLIPCHRIIRRNGEIGHYHWGSERKRAILQHEREMADRAFAPSEIKPAAAIV